MTSPMKKFRIQTLGCKVKQYESQAIREKLLSRGMKEAGRAENAQLCVVNTCTVTAKADRESRYAVRYLRKRNPGARIIVTGCLVKNKNKKELCADRITFFEGRTRAFLKIQDGCDNFCAFCKVPLVRGKPKSAPLAHVVEEARGLARAGYKEIVLTGICIGKYGKDLKPRSSLADCIRALERIKGIARIRISSLEPQDVVPALVEKLSSSEKLCPHLHIPLQSGDDAILKRMNRKYTGKGFVSLVKGIRRRVKDFALSTDVIVGFPGESEPQFLNTLKAIKSVTPMRVHIFPFSPRPGTRGCRLDGRVDERQVKERCGRLRALAGQCRAAFLGKFKGRKMELLVEARSKDRPGLWEGYTPNYVRAAFKSGKAKPNALVRVTLEPIFQG